MAYKKIQKHIEIVRSSIPALSSMSSKSCEALLALLKTHYATVDVSTVNTVFDLNALVLKKPDLAFMGMKYVPGLLPGKKIWVAGCLEKHGIAHTGSPKKAIQFEQSKPLAKQQVLDAGVKTSPYFIAQKGRSINAADITLQFPLFVKPTNLGAGQGVDDNSVVHTLVELNTKIRSVYANHATDAMVEEYLPGREFSVAVLKHEYSDDLMVMPLELIAGPNVHGDRVLSEELKSAKLETPTFPVADGKLRSMLIDLAANAFAALGARDYGRVDIRLDADGIPHFLEANLIPCLIQGSGNFPKACVMNIGMDYETMILHIVRLGLTRTARDEVEPIAVYSPIAATAPA
jgi:D-alanine-D-alanine ligase